MKSRQICIWMMLVSFAGVVLPGSVGAYNPDSFDQTVIRATFPGHTHETPCRASQVPFGEYGVSAWAEWIWPSCRRRHLPRCLLPRKLRRRLHFRLRRVLQRQRRTLREHRKCQLHRWGKTALLILVGMTLAFLLYAAASAWLAPARFSSPWPFIQDMPGCLQSTAAVPVAMSFVVGSGQKRVVCTERRHYQPEFDHCLLCGTALRSRRYLNWRKPIQMLNGNAYVTSRGRYCPHHPALTYVSAEAAQLSLSHSTYGLDVLVRIGYQRDYKRMTYAQVHEVLPDHIRVSQRHLSSLYREYLALLACAEQVDVEKLKAAAAQYGGLILSVDGLEPEGGQPQLWVAREVLTDTLLAAGWLPRVDEPTLREFLAPVKALDLPLLATVSDKQKALVKALEALWLDLPHQYCQAHYLGNAMTPVYDADAQMKIQLRKQVRTEAGVTMRQVQAEAKQKRADSGEPSPLIVTGLAARPPQGLDEVRASAQAVQRGAKKALRSTASVPVPSHHAVPVSGGSLDRVSSRTGLQACPEPGRKVEGNVSQNPQSMPAQPATRPRTTSEVREILRGSNVLLYERRRQDRVTPDGSLTPSPADRQRLVDELVQAYATRLRRILSQSGRKPFRLAGLRLYADLLALQSSLETALTHLPDEPRLSCFAKAIRKGLLSFEEDYTWIAEGYAWVEDINDILAVPLPEPGAAPPKEPLSVSVRDRLNAYLERLEQRTDLNAPLLDFRQHLRALTKRYEPGLFHCYDIPGLPRTNNDLESLFGRVRRQTLLTSGPHHAQQRLHEEGAWLLFDLVGSEHQQHERFQRVSLAEWRQARQHIREHRAPFTDDRRFRRQTSKYLASLEARAAEIAAM